MLQHAELTPEDRIEAEETLRRHLFGTAYGAFDCGDYPVARALFAQHRRRYGLYPKSALLSLACRMPAPVVRWARGLWRRFSRRQASEARERSTGAAHDS